VLALPDGRVLPVQVVGRHVAQRRLDADRHYPNQDEVDVVRVAFALDKVGPLGCALLEPVPARGRAAGDVRASGATLSNGLIEISVGDGGTLDLLDRVTGRRLDGLLRLEDEADAGDTYSFCPGQRSRLTRSAGTVRTRVLASGPLVGVLESAWSLPGDRIRVRLVVRLHAESPLVHCRLELDNHAIDHRLRARFPIGLAGTELVTGTQLGTMRRSPVRIDPRQFPAETPVATAPAHRFVAAAREQRGIAVLVSGFAEVEWTSAGDLLLTLFRAIGWLSRSDLSVRPGHAAWPEPTPLAQCPGRHVIELAFLPLTERDLNRPDRLLERWEEAFLPVQAFWLPDATDIVLPPDAVTLEGEGLVLSAVKPAEESAGIVLRCYNPRAEPVDGVWVFGTPRARARRIRADERGGEAVSLAGEGRAIAFSAAPGAWVTHVVE
jgi:hypothetical protein